MIFQHGLEREALKIRHKCKLPMIGQYALHMTNWPIIGHLYFMA